ncbi:MAG: hypothetical protein H6559_25125 [Lewinellaceae bacterium]|nr:hypothetical protein [Lewinellaceae bacterium]
MNNGENVKEKASTLTVEAFRDKWDKWDKWDNGINGILFNSALFLLFPSVLERGPPGPPHPFSKVL